MIKANELRIGNIFRGIGGIQTVLSLEENTDRGRCNYSSEEHRLMYSHLILCHQNGNQHKPFEIEPVPLTEEILLKVGFEKQGNDYIYTLSAIQIKTYKSGEKFYSYLHDIYIGDLIQHVHTLQNLLYCFGKELNTDGLI